MGEAERGWPDEPWEDGGVDWVEWVAEQRIQEAMEEGLFENLPDKGRPLVLQEYPFVPPGLRVPYKILHDAGFAPDWIELDKEICELESRLDQWVEGHLRWLRREREAWERGAASSEPKERRAARTRLRLAREAQAEALEEARRLLEARNRAVARFNRVVPNILWQKALWPVPERLEQIRRATEAAFPQGVDPRAGR